MLSLSSIHLPLASFLATDSTMLNKHPAPVQREGGRGPWGQAQSILHLSTTVLAKGPRRSIYSSRQVGPSSRENPGPSARRACGMALLRGLGGCAESHAGCRPLLASATPLSKEEEGTLRTDKLEAKEKAPQTPQSPLCKGCCSPPPRARPLRAVDDICGSTFQKNPSLRGRPRRANSLAISCVDHLRPANPLPRRQIRIQRQD